MPRSRGTVTRRTAGKAERAKLRNSSRSLPSGKLATNNSAMSTLRPPRSGFFGRLPDLPGARSAPAAPLKSNKRHTMAMESLAYAAYSSCFACFSSDWAAKNELAPLARIHETLDKGTQNCRLTWRPKRGLSRRPRAAGRSPGQLAAGWASAALSAAGHARARAGPLETSDRGKATGRNGARDTLQYLVRPRLIIRRRRRAPRRRPRRTSGRARPSARATRRRPAGRRTSLSACRRGASSRRS